MGRKKKTSLSVPTLVEPEKLPVDVILGKLREKFELKSQREKKVAEAMLIRKEVYNLSQKINRLEEEIDKTLIEKVLGYEY